MDNETWRSFYDNTIPDVLLLEYFPNVLLELDTLYGRGAVMLESYIADITHRQIL